MKKKKARGSAGKHGRDKHHVHQQGNAAILYHPEGYTVASAGKLMGRHAAGEGFLNGFLSHAGVDCFYAYAEREEHFAQFKSAVAAIAGNSGAKWIAQTAPERLGDVGALYIPDPDLASHAWIRRCHDSSAYSLTGVTHTICSDRIMDALCNILLAPVEPWDAIICTSRVVRSSIERMIAGYGEYLKERVQAKEIDAKIQLPIIPLGVDYDAFANTQKTTQARADFRKQLGIGEDDIVALFMGRFSYHAKAHPLPMYIGMESAARSTKRKLWLIQAGWFPNDHIQAEFLKGARQYCPSVKCVFVDGRKPEIRHNIWFAADIFISLPDNIQETFGITPVEAMAAGLPAVVTDWNGYKDTVEEGVTGFRIPTLMPSAGCGKELAYRFMSGVDTYDRYIGLASQSVAVDIGATARVITELVSNSDLRVRMGENGRKRAREVYDWRVIIRQYQELWTELGARRKSVADSPLRRPAPHRPDPYWLFSDYPTRVITTDSSISISVNNPEMALKHLLKANMNCFAAPVLLRDNEYSNLFAQIGKHDKIAVTELMENYPPDRHATVQRTLAWLAKLGIVKVNA